MIPTVVSDVFQSYNSLLKSELQSENSSSMCSFWISMHRQFCIPPQPAHLIFLLNILQLCNIIMAGLICLLWTGTEEVCLLVLRVGFLLFVACGCFCVLGGCEKASLEPYALTPQCAQGTFKGLKGGQGSDG